MNARMMLVGFTAAVLSASCATSIPASSRTKPLVTATDKTDDKRGLEGAPMFLQLHTQTTRMIDPVRLNGLSLAAVMKLVLPESLAVPMDGSVNMQRAVNLQTEKMSEAQFLELLGTLTSYEITRRNASLIEIRSWMTKEWSLSAYSVNSTVTFSAGGSGSGGGSGGGGGGSQGGNGGGGGGGNGGGGGGSGAGSSSINATFANNLNEWAAVVETARAILGSTAGIAGESLAKYGTPSEILGYDPSNPLALLAANSAQAAAVAGGPVAVKAPEPQLVAIQSLGLIQASGPVPRVRELDRRMQSLMKKSSRQFRIDARIIEITLTDKKSRGIDWSALGKEITKSGIQIGYGFGFSAPALGDPAAGALNLNGGATFGDEKLTAVLNFLSRYGTVELRDEPQGVALNGRTVYLGSGEEFGYVATIAQNISNGSSTLTPQFSRILIGLQIAVTPRLMDDGRILMDVVPLVSSFRGFDNFTVQGNQFSQPRVALKQLATQAVTRSGEPIQLGGLISSRVTQEIRKLPPVDQSLLGLEGVLDQAVGAEENVLDRRELLILVTPYLIES